MVHKRFSPLIGLNDVVVKTLRNFPLMMFYCPSHLDHVKTIACGVQGKELSYLKYMYNITHRSSTKLDQIMSLGSKLTTP